MQRGVELTDPGAYRARLIGLVGERDPIEVLGETAGRLRRAIEGVRDEVLTRRPGPGRWSAAEVIGHLVDTEWVFGWRIRTVWCDDQPTLMGMDQQTWLDTQGHRSRPAWQLIEDFAALRAINVGLWRSIPEGDLERVGMHAERGPESLRVLRSLHAGHDLAHIAQVERTIAAVG